MILKRITAKDNTGIPVMGVLLQNGTPFAVTLERPWMNNQQNVSCIPDGMYACERIESPKFGETFRLINVSGRSHILFHKGNIDDDTHGCILVGESFEPLSGEPAIRASKKGFKEFMELLNEQDMFTLCIEWA